MPKIKVGFGAVLGNKHLTVLERAHRSGINVDVGIELDAVSYTHLTLPTSDLV